MGWVADDVSDNHWLGPAIALGVSIIVFLIGQRLTTRISFDMLEHCDPSTIKDTCKNNWTNIGVTSALLLTLVAAMLQVDPIEPQGFSLDEDETKTLLNLQQTYVTFVVAALFFLLLSVVLSVLNISYLDPLSDRNSLKFILKYPDSIGDPIVTLGEGCLMMYIASCIWVWGAHGLMQGVIAATTLLLFLTIVIAMWVNRAAFDPTRLDYAWTQEEDKWPTSFGWGVSSVAPQYKFVTPQIRRIVRRLGAPIVAAEGGNGALLQQE